MFISKLVTETNYHQPLPPSYYRDVWDYKHANIESIQKAFSNFDCFRAFLHRNANEKCEILKLPIG